MPDLVIDASVAVKWVSPDEEAADRAVSMLADYQRGGVSFLAPLFWQYEVVNGVNKAVARGELAETEGREVVEALMALDVTIEPFPPPQDAYGLARKYGRSVYDSLYLDLAERRGCEFWTGDRKLYNAAKGRLPFVRWIGEY
ncbi:MAG: type II toxin-antitoxin system VapC family toxin [Planctomycetota bacterium]